MAPSANDDLVFPSSASNQIKSNQINQNDYTVGTTFHSITVSGAGYELNGNDINLTNGFVAGGADVGMNINVTLAVDFASASV